MILREAERIGAARARARSAGKAQDVRPRTRPARRPEARLDRRPAAVRWQAAHHEAGHALAALALGARDVAATIVPTASEDGATSYLADGLGAVERVAIVMAGGLADAKFTRRDFDVYRDSPADAASIERLTQADPQSRHAGAVLAGEIVLANWSRIQSIAAVLFERRTLGHSALTREAA
ncbi:MAG: hypothetical protein HY943_21110 [Gammaproteobacteria bacterium]|nr:hypothetical protein [Gammaproteobacteria bacterium]